MLPAGSLRIVVLSSTQLGTQLRNLDNLSPGKLPLAKGTIVGPLF